MSKNVQPFSDEQRVLINNITEQHSIEQLAWLSGYLWGVVTNKTGGLSAQTSTSPATSAPSSPAEVPAASQLIMPPTITILSASQTGNARRVAQDLNHDIERLGLPVKHVSASDYKFKQMDKEHYLIMVTSTQGEGEPPEEALALYKYLFSKKAPTLSQLYFSVLGLGDASYVNFCQAGKEFDRRFEELGAKRIVARVDADTDYQTECDLWRQHIVNHLLQHTKQTNTDSRGSDLTSELIVDSGRYHRDNPFSATVSLNQKITAHQSAKNICHIELDLTDSGLSYRPGDALGVWYKNSPQLVAELLAYLQLAAETPVTVNGEQLTVEQALIEKYELTQNTPNIVKQYAKLTADKNLLRLIDDMPALRDFSQQTPIIDMIQCYPYPVNAQDFIEILRALTPRLYSIASSQDEVGNEAHLTVNVVQYDVNGHTRFGGASSFLASQSADQGSAEVFIEPNDHFRLPSDNTVPIIMIGAGTGIAPFRAFMQQRASEQATGKNWLIFGNPHAISDFLYQLEWQQYVKDKILTRIDLAWSRDQVTKIYVQDKLQQHASEVWQWLQQGAHFYVCGDASTMAKAVNETLLSIIKQQGNLSHEQAQDYLDQLRINRRYQKDTY